MIRVQVGFFYAWGTIFSFLDCTILILSIVPEAARGAKYKRGSDRIILKLFFHSLFCLSGHESATTTCANHSNQPTKIIPCTTRACVEEHWHGRQVNRCRERSTEEASNPSQDQGEGWHSVCRAVPLVEPATIAKTPKDEGRMRCKYAHTHNTPRHIKRGGTTRCSVLLIAAVSPYNVLQAVLH